MGRIIKVRYAGAQGWETKEVDLEEAKKMVQDTYADGCGGLVADAKTNEIIWGIGPDVDEIIVMPETLGAGG